MITIWKYPYSWLGRSATKYKILTKGTTKGSSVPIPGLFILGISLFFFFISDAHPACNFVTITDVNFGSYDTLSSLNNDSTGSIAVTCDAHTWVTTSIGASPNSGGFNPRQMLNAVTSELLNYNLFRNSARTEIWGNGTQGTYTMYQRINKNHTSTWTIYGRIPPGQDVGVGNYGEVLVVTINY